MKNALVFKGYFFTLLCLFFNIWSLSAQRYNSNGFVTGVDYASDKVVAVKIGLTWNKYQTKTRPAFHESVNPWYKQICLRYNLIDKAVGLQPTLAYSAWGLGGRIMLNAEYGLVKKKTDLSLLFLAGLDLVPGDRIFLPSFSGRKFALLLGLNLNLTKNLTANPIGFAVTAEYTIGKHFWIREHH